MFTMSKVNIVFHRLYIGDVINKTTKTCIIARLLRASLRRFGNVSAPLALKSQVTTENIYVQLNTNQWLWLNGSLVPGHAVVSSSAWNAVSVALVGLILGPGMK